VIGAPLDITITSFAKTFLDDVDGPGVLSTLGLSSYIQTLIDDVDAGAALTTLGVSAFAQTLTDDLDALTARATLGVGTAKILSQTALGSSSIDFTSGIDSNYSTYIVVCNGVRPATNGANLFLRVSNAGAFKTDTNYEYHTSVPASTLTSYASVVGSATNGLVLAQGMSNSTDDNGSFVVVLHEPSNTTHNKILTWKGGYTSSSPSALRADGSGAYFGSVAAIDGLRFQMTSGNIAEGEFTLYGLR